MKLDNISSSMIAKGFIEHEDSYECIFCGSCFEKGLIYVAGNNLCDAHKAMQIHIEEQHKGVLLSILDNPDLNPLSKIQNQILHLEIQGKTNREISEELQIAESTVRVHKHNLRSLFQRSKILAAIEEILSKNPPGEKESSINFQNIIALNCRRSKETFPASVNTLSPILDYKKIK